MVTDAHSRPGNVRDFLQNLQQESNDSPLSGLLEYVSNQPLPPSFIEGPSRPGHVPEVHLRSQTWEHVAFLDGLLGITTSAEERDTLWGQSGNDPDRFRKLILQSMWKKVEDTYGKENAQRIIVEKFEELRQKRLRGEKTIRL